MSRIVVQTRQCTYFRVNSKLYQQLGLGWHRSKTYVESDYNSELWWHNYNLPHKQQKAIKQASFEKFRSLHTTMKTSMITLFSLFATAYFAFIDISSLGAPLQRFLDLWMPDKLQMQTRAWVQALLMVLERLLERRRSDRRFLVLFLPYNCNIDALNFNPVNQNFLL